MKTETVTILTHEGLVEELSKVHLTAVRSDTGIHWRTLKKISQGDCLSPAHRTMLVLSSYFLKREVERNQAMAIEEAMPEALAIVARRKEKEKMEI